MMDGVTKCWCKKSREIGDTEAAIFGKYQQPHPIAI
jgi:hypothetical protein